MMGKMLDRLTSGFKSKPEEDTGPTVEQLLANLEQEDISESTRLSVWKQRARKEQWNFNDADVVRLNVQSFVAAFQYTDLCDKFGYFVMVKNINYIDGTVTIVLKSHKDIREYTFHVFDFERVIRGCTVVLGINAERSQYLLNSTPEKVEEPAPVKEEPTEAEPAKVETSEAERTNS